MGSVVNLSVPAPQLPDVMAVDSNVVIARPVASGLEPGGTNASRAVQFFRGLQASGSIGLITPTALSETFHVAIKAKYRSEPASHRAELAAGYGPRRRYDWLDLYKLDADILRRFATELDDLRQRLLALSLRLVAPEDLGPLPSGLSYDEELIRLIGRYGLDTSDTLILLEAQRVGVLEVVSLDRDMRRAQVDFVVYAWA